MQRVVIDEPYEFIPPVRSTRWIPFFKRILGWNLRRMYGLQEITCVNTEKLRASVDAGHGVILCPNHCRPSDPLAMGQLTVDMDLPLYSMASWHVFKESPITNFVIRRVGAFSIYREGMDRTSLNYAINVLTEAERPLVIFPEGVISRTNAQLGTLMDGTAFIARSAAKKRAAQDPSKKVVIHPVGLRYKFLSDVEQAVSPTLTEIERRLAWQPLEDRPIVERLARIGNALLSLKEIEYIGFTQNGSLYDRIEGLIDHVLHPLEHEWLKGRREGDVVARVKNLRSAIIPDLVTGTHSEEETQRRWRHLTDVYFAQQLRFYPREYVREDSPPERLLETIEKFEEDLTDKTRVYGPMHLTLEIGDPIEVSPKRERGPDGDPTMRRLEKGLNELLSSLQPKEKSLIASAG